MRIPYLPLLSGLCWGFLLAAGPAVAANGEGPAQPQQKLEAVRSRIGALGTALAGELKKRDALMARLRDADLAITQQRKALENVRSQRDAVEKRRAHLASEQALTQKNLDAQRTELSRQLRAAYMIGRQEQLKLLLNQESPSMLGRMLAYYGYFGQARAVQIEAIGRDVDRLKAMGQQIEAQGAKIAELNRDAQRELQSLVRARAERSAALSVLGQRVQSANQEIARLKQEEQGIESLVANLQRVLPDFALGPQRPFGQMRGKLPWPVPGRLAARFHQLRGGSHSDSIRWNGVMISAAHGAKVRSPYFGRVIYADWLQGLGLLLIIDHGGGYLSLFGHSEVLYKSVGDTVSPGDVIAGLAEDAAPQLYFEVRQGRTPLDPQDWMKSGG